MRYRTIGTDPATRREVSVLGLGAMYFGTRTDEPTAFAVLERYVAAGGTFVDTSNNYAYWVDGDLGGQGEELLGRWRRSPRTREPRRVRRSKRSPRWLGTARRVCSA